MNLKGCLLLAACAALAGLPAARAASGAPDFQLGDLQKIVSLSEARISPDGRQIASIVSTPDWKTDKAQREIDLVDVQSGARRALTWSTHISPRTSCAAPMCTADGWSG